MSLFFTRRAGLLLAIGSVILLNSCSKEPQLVQSPQPQVAVSNVATTIHSPANKPMGAIIYLRNGDSIVYEPGKPPVGFKDPNARVYGCGVDPFFSFQPIYHGYNASLSGCTDDPNTVITFTFYMEVHVQYNLQPTSATKGRMKLIGNLFYPTTIKSGDLSATYIGSYYNAYSEEVNKFSLSFTVSLTVDEYCNYEEIAVYTNAIPTDCDDNPSYVVTATTDYLTPQTYKVYPYMATGTTPGYMTVFPAVTLCQNCHEPALGSSPEHIFEYRLQGSSTWTAVTYTNLSSHNISLPAGNYEYRSKGKLLANGTYSGYTPVYPVTVN
ncbi:MAG TPA: hypothetical protein VD996_10390 [Chitinophagaceae bacterium]|nr:hypothetical protein [Chitinophagaceae bacterium]